jgi:hypothetical protein
VSTFNHWVVIIFEIRMCTFWYYIILSCWLFLIHIQSKIYLFSLLWSRCPVGSKRGPSQIWQTTKEVSQEKLGIWGEGAWCLWWKMKPKLGVELGGFGSLFWVCWNRAELGACFKQIRGELWGFEGVFLGADLGLFEGI